MAKSREQEHPVKAFGWVARDPSGHLSPFNFSRSHEIVGVETEVGNKVTKFKVGHSKSCESCSDNLENYRQERIFTYNSKYYDGTTTYGGYSDIMVVDESSVIGIPEKFPLDGAAPMQCAGITVYSPLKYYGLDKPGLHLGVVGLGGLGHMAVKFAKAMGLKVTVISTSPNKREEAIQHLGRCQFVLGQSGSPNK